MLFRSPSDCHRSLRINGNPSEEKFLKSCSLDPKTLEDNWGVLVLFVFEVPLDEYSFEIVRCRLRFGPSGQGANELHSSSSVTLAGFDRTRAWVCFTQNERAGIK